MSERTTKLGTLESVDYEYLLTFAARTNLLRTMEYTGQKEVAAGLARTLRRDEVLFLKTAYSTGQSAADAAGRFLLVHRPTASVLSGLLQDWLVNGATSISKEVLFSEFPVAERRVDIVRLNSRSYAYEVKSRRDTFKRLVQQLEAALQVFEYVYAVLDRDGPEVHTLPSVVGLIETYSVGPSITFRVSRSASKNVPSSPLMQLLLLSMPEIRYLLASHEMPMRGLDCCERHWILDRLGPEEVNLHFKQALRRRYKCSWRESLGNRYQSRA